MVDKNSQRDSWQCTQQWRIIINRYELPIIVVENLWSIVGTWSGNYCLIDKTMYNRMTSERSQDRQSGGSPVQFCPCNNSWPQDAAFVFVRFFVDSGANKRTITIRNQTSFVYLRCAIVVAIILCSSLPRYAHIQSLYVLQSILLYSTSNVYWTSIMYYAWFPLTLHSVPSSIYYYYTAIIVHGRSQPMRKRKSSMSATCRSCPTATTVLPQRSCLGSQSGFAKVNWIEYLCTCAPGPAGTLRRRAEGASVSCLLWSRRRPRQS